MNNSIEKNKEKVIKKYGPWTAHDIKLSDNIYTIGKDLNYDTLKLRRVMQILHDVVGQELKQSKILDLGSLEGLYTIELGMRGVKEAIGIEAREANLKKAEFSKDILNIENIKFYKDDVRNLSKQKYGTFDIILCLGLLYDMDTPDVFHLLENMYGMCGRALIIDTHIALKSDKKIEFNGKIYYGSFEREFRRGLSKEQKLKRLWSALDNERNFLFSKKSLLRILRNLGFSSTYECHSPFEYIKPDNRVTVLALKGVKVKLCTYPDLNNIKEGDIKDNILKSESRSKSIKSNIVLLIKRTPRILKELLKTITFSYYREE